MTSRAPHLGGGKIRYRAGLVVAAFEGSLETVPITIVAGLVAFAPLGKAGSGVGIAAGFVAALVAGALVGSLADRRGLVATPSLALALMTSAVLATLARRGMLQKTDDVGAAIALSMLLCGACGLLMAALAVLGIGRLVPLVPYPVLSGLRNGTAILLVLEQAPEAVGMRADGLAVVHPAACIVAAATVAAMLVRIRGVRLLPPIVMGLVAGTAVYHAVALLPGGELLAGPEMGPMLPRLFVPRDIAAAFAALPAFPSMSLIGVLLPAILSMTALAALETIACASALQSETGERSNGRRDLLAVALANVVGGALGALPASGNLETTIGIVESTVKRSRLAALLRSVFILGIALLAMPFLALVPRSVLAGVVIVAAVHVADLSIVRMVAVASRAGLRHRAEGIGNLLVVISVAAVAVAFGLIAAVIIGVVLSLVVFTAAMARSPVRRRYASPLGRSRTRRGEHETQALLAHGAAIEVIELQGAIFFGSADHIAGEIEAVLAGGARFVILDFGRVHRVDLSGARSLLGTCERLWREDRWLALAGLRPGQPVWDYFSDLGYDTRLPRDRVFGTLEDAIDGAEVALLRARAADTAPNRVPTGAEALASLRIPPSVVPVLLPHMTEVEFAAGSMIIEAGDASREMFVLLAGRVEVWLPVRPMGRRASLPEHRSTRIATLAPGTLFGEMALLSNAPRAASVVAQTPVRCLRLDLADLEVLRSEHPDASWHLLTAIALQIELNLRLTNAALESYEE
jgi:SulP family sulfate permease